MKYILDTNILLIYLKHNSIRSQIEESYSPFSIQNIPIVSTVCLGELESIAMRNNWGYKRMKSMESLVSKCVVTEIHSRDLHKRYGEIDAFSQGKLASRPLLNTSHNMGKMICGFRQPHLF